MKTLILALVTLTASPAFAAQFVRQESAQLATFQQAVELVNDFCNFYSEVEGHGTLGCTTQHFKMTSRSRSEPLLQSVKQLQYRAYQHVESIDVTAFDRRESTIRRELANLFDWLMEGDISEAHGYDQLSETQAKVSKDLTALLSQARGLKFFSAGSQGAMGHGSNLTLVDENSGEILIIEATYSE